MASNQATVAIRVTDESRQGFESFKSSMREASASVDRFASSFANFRNAFAIFAGGAFTQQIVSAAVEADRASRLLEATLKATGNAAGLTKGQIDDLADSLAGVSEFDDESIREGAAALLKFGTISGDTFERALKASVDLAAFLRTGVADAANQVGAALTNSAGGLGRLERAFGDLTASEKEALKQFEEAGDILGAFDLKLGIVEKRIGGVAKELTGGLYGATKELGKAWGELLEGFGKTADQTGLVERSLRGLATLLNDIRDESQGKPTPLQGLMSFGLVPPRAAVSPLYQGGAPRREADPAAVAAAAQARANAELEADIARGIQNAKALEKERIDASRQFQSERQRLFAEDRKGWIAYADSIFEEADRINLALAKIYDDQAQAELRQRAEDIRKQIEFIDETMRLEREAGMQTPSMAQLRDLNLERTKESAKELGLIFVSAAEESLAAWEGFGNFLRSLEKDLIRFGTRRLLTEPAIGKLDELFKSIGSGAGIFDSIMGLFANAKGNVFGPSGVTAFANGGIVDRPALFPFANGIGLMGEAGPEAIMPLKRGQDGRLGVEASGGRSITININATSPMDARSGSQIAAQVGRAVNRALARNG